MTRKIRSPQAEAQRRGSYYCVRTQEWLAREGYHWIPMEHQRRIFVPAKDGKPEKIFFSKQDLWGADLLASNGERLVAVQVKSSKAQAADGMRALLRAPWPGNVTLWVVWWEPRARQPNVINCRDSTSSATAARREPGAAAGEARGATEDEAGAPRAD